uniref:Acidic protein n=1 Tax=Oryza punctata TaxID=4537 RepID=A0A0E0KLX0_ORYPU
MVVRRQVMVVVMVLCWALLATAARGNCRDECLAGCNGWAVICHLSCNSACLGEVGISTMNTATPQSTTDQDQQHPSQLQQKSQHSVSMLKGLDPDKI